MSPRFRDLVSPALPRDPAPAEGPPAPELAPLRLLAAPMLLLTGVEATRDSLSGARGVAAEAGGRERWPARASLAAVWAPALVAPLAAAAQVAHLSRPSAAVSAASRLLNAAVVGAGAAALAGALAGDRGRRAPSLAPLGLAAAGLLGLLLDRQARRIAEERERLEKRARVVERLVPRRRARVERIVVHV